MSVCKIELVDSMGNDLSVVNAARVSFNKQVDKFSDKDEKLIKYLAEHGHWSPFAHVQYSVRIVAPIYVARQWFKHTVGLARNEVSRRYVSDHPIMANINPLRYKHENKKQGSGDTIPSDENEKICKMIEDNNYNCYLIYKYLIDRGICPEQARMVLPLNTTD